MSDYLPPPTENPYAPPSAPVFTQESNHAFPPLARKLTRLAAKILDNIFMYGGIFLAMIPIMVMSAQNPNTSESATGLVFIVFILIAMGLWAAVACANGWFIHTRGQTLGKMVLKIKILRSDYSPVSLARVFGLRFLLTSLISAIPFIGGIFSIVDSCMIFAEPRRCIHDYIADTIVVEA